MNRFAWPTLVVVTGLLIGVAVAVRLDWQARKRYADEHLYEAIKEFHEAEARKQQAIDDAQRREEVRQASERIERDGRAIRAFIRELRQSLPDTANE
jgi:hypothetical protein